MDIVYLLNEQSNWNNNEIRYSIRSIVKHIQNFDNIYIIGYLPNFIQNVVYYRKNDISNNPAHNIADKLHFAANIEKLSDNFFYFNDDYFLNSDIIIEDYPAYYNNSKVSKIMDRSEGDVFKRFMLNTYSILLEQEATRQNYYDIHRPAILNKAEVIRILNLIDYTKKSFLFKTLYFNLTNLVVKSEAIKDIKFNSYNRFLDTSSMFSTGNSIQDNLKEFIINLYPNKSIYESS